MNKKTKNIILVVAAVQILIAVFLVGTPAVVQAVPLDTQYRIQDRVPASVPFFELFGAPTPALPPVASRVAGAELTVPALDFATATSTPEPTPTIGPATPTADAAPAEDEAPAAPTATPTTPPTPTPAPTEPPLPSSARLSNLVNIPQNFNNCGPANLTVVLNYHNIDMQQTEAASYLKPNPEDRNVSPWQITDYVNEQIPGMRASAHSGGDFLVIKRLVNAGFPVVVEKGYDPNTTEGWYGHYLTVFGYDDEGFIFNVIDTYLGPFDANGGVEGYQSMANLWQHFNYTFFVIYPENQEALVQSILGPDLLDPQTMWQNAALRAQEDIEEDPDNAFAWFNLGTSVTRLGELTGEQSYYQAGAEAFDSARSLGLPWRMLWYQHRPYIAYWKTGRVEDMIELANATLETSGGRNVEETYYYRGLAYSIQGDISAARSDMQQALRLNENFYPAQITLDYLNTLTG